jgi:phosphohistidine phosphatase
MKLILVRHGEAVQESEDISRPLTRPGKEAIQRLAYLLKKMDVTMDRILCSPKLRAQQTALILREALSPHCPMEEKEYLSPASPKAHRGGPNAPLDQVLEAIARNHETLMIVSHFPLLPLLTSQLLIGKDDPVFVKFSEGTTALLERDPYGQWQFISLVSPSWGK